MKYRKNNTLSRIKCKFSVNILNEKTKRAKMSLQHNPKNKCLGNKKFPHHEKSLKILYFSTLELQVMLTFRQFLPLTVSLNSRNRIKINQMPWP